MALKIKLKPDEVFIVNGCVMQNGPRRTFLIVQNFANIVRGDDLITKEEATTPVRAVYYAIQSLLTNPTIIRDSLAEVQQTLARIYKLLPRQDDRDAIMVAANNVSVGDFYKALAALRPVIHRESGEGKAAAS